MNATLRGDLVTRPVRSVSRRVLACFAAIGFVGLLMQGCSKQEAFHKPAIPVKTQPVETSLPEAGLKYSATLAPREQVDLAFKVPGYVEEILKLPGPDGVLRDVQKGDHVARGALLAKLRDIDYQTRLKQAKSALEEARASLSQANIEYDRADRLMQASALAKSQYDQAREKLDVTKARLSGAESQVEEVQIQLQDTVLKSPLDCVLVARFIERGALVASGTRAYSLADLSSVKAVFGVPDYVLRQVKLGDSLTIGVEGIGNKTFPGVVTAISPSADPKSRVFEVEITVPNPGLLLKDGMIAAVQVRGDAGEVGLPAVPLHAVVRPPGDLQGYMVFILGDREGKPVALGRKVSIGKVFGNHVSVTEGLNVGERIITTGATLVWDGAEVSVIP